MPDWIVDAVNDVLGGFVDIVDVLLGWLPDSPFREPIESISSGVFSEMFGYINYFLPVSEMLAVTTVWLSAVVVYYGVSVVLRWIKAIS